MKNLLCISFLFLCQFSFAQVKVKTYFNQDNTQLKEEYTVTDTFSNNLVGSYTSYYVNKQVKSKGQFVNNKAEGIWEYYYENGNLKMKGELKGNQYHGNWIYFYENGNKSMEGRIIEGDRQGDWKFYFENGTVKSSGKFIDDKKEGTWNYYFEDGTLKAQAFFENNSGPYREFYPSGKIYASGYNLNGQSDSLWTYYYENGKEKAVGNYTNGIKVGIWKYYYANGNKSAQGNFENGQKSGKWIYYHKNGEISSEGAIANGKKDGYWKLFYENGEFKGESVLQDGDGEYTEYYHSGKLKIKGHLKNGKNQGKWFYYSEDGILEGEADFDNGSGEYTGYYRDGGKRMQGKIEDGENVGVWKLYEKSGDLAGFYRPYYEDKKPIFKIIEQQEIEVSEQSDVVKPEYRYRNRKLRYFSPKINEYSGLIIASNPIAMSFGNLPISIEYHIQERLGYEFQYLFIRDPFFMANKNIALNNLYERGFALALRQKFYHPTTDIGSLYFGHEIRYTMLNHAVNKQDNGNSAAYTVDADQNRFEYSLLIGNRWIKFFGDKWMNNAEKTGITIDIFAGAGLGYREYKPNYSTDDASLFRALDKKHLLIPLRLGINIGYIF